MARQKTAIDEAAIERLFVQFFRDMRITDGNPEVDLSRTPGRIARMYVRELLSGYDDAAVADLRARFTVFNKARRHELVLIQGVPFYSLCAHHMMPFFGTASLGYLPKDHVIGLSKFPRVLKLFARRLQTQENLTGMVADFVFEEAKPEALIVHLRATHLCCAARGVETPGVEMVTSALRSADDFPASLKAEFYSLLGS